MCIQKLAIPHVGQVIKAAMKNSEMKQNETKWNNIFFLECSVPLDLTQPSGDAGYLCRVIRGMSKDTSEGKVSSDMNMSASTCSVSRGLPLLNVICA